MKNPRILAVLVLPTSPLIKAVQYNKSLYRRMVEADFYMIHNHVLGSHGTGNIEHLKIDIINYLMDAVSFRLVYLYS
jgi:hypothetical protein